MKFGQKLEQQSVPEWSIHNVDYNSLKYEIKAHTTRDQARGGPRAIAIPIPGQPDPALQRFEAGFFDELCRQHDRVDLFVESKASEIASKLEYLAQALERFGARLRRAPVMNLKQQRRLLKYEHEVLRCGDDVQSLFRFTAAQVEAFRKILKKYKRWTGSARLGDRFREHILTDPKSFTRRDLTHLRSRYDETRGLLRRVAPPPGSEPTSPESNTEPERATTPGNPHSRGHPAVFQPLPPPSIQYWNEYDHGSDGEGPDEEGYALYIDPQGDTGFFPGFMTTPLEKAKLWFSGASGKKNRASGEGGPLLPEHRDDATGYSTFSSSRPGTDDEDDLTSNEDAYFSPASEADAYHRRYYHHHPTSGSDDYEAGLARRESVELALYRQSVMFWGTVSAFCLALVLTGIAGAMLLTGRRKRKVQVNAGATVGVITSMFCACAGLGMHIARKGDDGPRGYGGGAVRWWVDLAVWVVGMGVLALDGMLLILVIEW